MNRYVVRCVECGRRFDDLDAYDLHMKSTPHERDAVFIASERYSIYRERDDFYGTSR